MCNLLFVTKKNSQRGERKKKAPWEVKVAIAKEGKAVNLTFRNYSFKQLGSKERISYCASGSRLYFKEDEDGWKLQTGGKRNNPGSRYIHIPAANKSLKEWADKYRGEYKLLFDDENKLYCIDANGAAS